MRYDLDQWMNSEGERFFKEIGVKRGQIVLDFGCGVGHYTIPAARVVGIDGKVYAVDKDSRALNHLMEFAESKGLLNIVKVDTSGDSEVNLEDDLFDVVLLYDVFHSYYFNNKSDRKNLLKEVHRVLKRDGFVSIYPKHIGRGEVIGELEDCGFYFEREVFKRLIHDQNFDIGNVLIFGCVNF